MLRQKIKTGEDSESRISSWVVEHFISEVEKLINLNLWHETNQPVVHRFGSVRLFAFAKPYPGVTFFLGEKKWRVIGKRILKEGQYAKELYTDHKGTLQHVEIPMSRYEQEVRDFHEEKETVPF